jgi:phosphoribosylanthranilate isomerase
MRTRVKICGITRPEDGRDAAACGVDAIGLVFYEKSPRAVSIEQARTICEAMPPFVSVVGLFVNPEASQVAQVLGSVPIDLLQFHGKETAEFCGEFVRPYIKTIAMHKGQDTISAMAAYPVASGFLFDADLPDIHGGGGITFDWSQLPEGSSQPMILAGGLTPENVTDAIAQTRPYAVDVSSGVEISKGIKSADKIAAFMKGVHSGDTS